MNIYEKMSAITASPNTAVTAQSMALITFGSIE